MPSPWLTVPLADYEGHMEAAEVRQLGALADLFAEALEFCRPQSVAVLGIAGGNGLERIDGSMVRRVVGVDAHPGYLDAVRRRFGAMAGLELHCADLAEETLDLAPVDLVHAALIFEHAGTGRPLENALALAGRQGAIAVVLQLASDIAEDLSATPFPSIAALKPHFTLVDPARFRETLEGRGFRLVHQRRRPLPAGKAFWMGIFARHVA